MNWSKSMTTWVFSMVQPFPKNLMCAASFEFLMSQNCVGTLASLSLSNNKLESIAGIRDLKEKKLKVLNVDENPIADKKVFKLLRGDRPEHIIKELLKYLQKQGGGGGGKKKKK